MLFNNIAVNNQAHRLSVNNNKVADFNNFFQVKDDSYFSKQNPKVISFKAITKLQKFDILANSEKRDIQNVAKRLFKDKNALLTLLDKKPSALVVVSESDFKSIIKHSKLLESEQIRFIIQDKTEKNHNKHKRNIYVVNTVEFKSVLENNIDFLRYRLNDPDLNVDKAFTVLTSKDSPLFDIKNYHDLIGICLGFPSQDSMMFNLRRDIANLLKDFEVRGREGSNAFKTLDLLYSILQPPQSQALLRNNGFKESKIEKLLSDWNIKKPQSNETNRSGGYAFITWDKNSKEYSDIQHKLNIGLEEIKRKIKSSGDVLQILLSS